MLMIRKGYETPSEKINVLLKRDYADEDGSGDADCPLGRQFTQLVHDPGVYGAAPQRPEEGPMFELGQPVCTAAQP